MMVPGLSYIHRSEQNRRVLGLRRRGLGTWELKNGLRWEFHVNSGLYLTLISEHVQTRYLGRSAEDLFEFTDVRR